MPVPLQMYFSRFGGDVPDVQHHTASNNNKYTYLEIRTPAQLTEPRLYRE